MVDLHDYDIELIEREILWKYNDNRRDYLHLVIRWSSVMLHTIPITH